jgi:katanin p80 WD40 repeat-containing subunit B1
MNNNNPKRVIKLSEYPAHGSNVTSCAIGHKSNRIAATGGEDKKVNLWALNKPTCIMSLTGHTSAVNSITFSANEDKIVSGSASGALKLWDLEVSRLICNLVGHKANVTCLEYHNYADYIASGSIDSQIRLWDLRRKGCIFTYKGHTNSVNALRFSPDSKWIASVSDDNLVKIWDLKAGRLLTDLKSHTSAVNALEFHPNEYLLATGSSDKTVKFWDLEKMELVSTSPPAPNPVKVIMFEQSGKCLFSGCQDYLQSISWEPAECNESVFCQWKHVADMTNNANKLTACSFNQNSVSFYVVDLLQVAPIGVYVPNSAANETLNEPTTIINSSRQVTAASSHHNHNQTTTSSSAQQPRPLSNSNRRNFSLNYDKLEATEQPDENQVQQQLQNESVQNDNSKADIYNIEEYNKIFRPQKEIKRPSSTNALSSLANNSHMSSSTSFTSAASIKKSVITAKKSIDTSSTSTPHIDEVVTKQPASAVPVAVDQSFFVDIKVAPNPNLQNKVSQQQPQSPKTIKQDNLNIKEEKLEDKFDKVNIHDFMPTPEHQVKMEIVDLSATIEQGHESFMKALKNRFKNTQMIRSMWINGSIKSALDTAANMNDTSLMADILSQINQSVNVWNLDICTILLPSIKELIGSKYEEHAQIGSDSCKIVFKNFGKLIKASLFTPVNVGVDISREERQRKCNSCYGYLQDIIHIIERKMAMISSQKLLNNFKEINLLMKTLEN